LSFGLHSELDGGVVHQGVWREVFLSGCVQGSAIAFACHTMVFAWDECISGRSQGTDTGLIGKTNWSSQIAAVVAYVHVNL
jgi:hypothetical protein